VKRYFLIGAFLLLSTTTVYPQSQGPIPGPLEPSHITQDYTQNKNKYANDLQRSANHEMLQINRNVNTKESNTYTKNEATNRNNRPTYNWGIWFFSLVVAGCAIAQVIALIYQYCAMRDQVKHLKDSVVATEKAANAADRSANAVVRMESPVIRVFSPPLVAISISTSAQGVFSQSLIVNGLKFVNHGRTPAFPERLDTGWMVINKLPVTPAYTVSNDLSSSDPIITETFMTETSEMIEPTADQWEQISKGTRLWYYGCFYYRNFMNDRQEFRFCWGLFNAATTGQNPAYRFLSCGDTPEAYTKNT
jgi:hypothetical protein